MLISSVYLLAVWLIVCCRSIRIPLALRSEGADSVRNVLSRLPLWILEEFPDIQVEEQTELAQDRVRISIDATGKKSVAATSPTAALYGINHFLRDNCFTQIAWDNSSFGKGCLPLKEKIIEMKAPMVRHFGNPCTFSYSFVWWNWSHWEKLIDWMALNGFNMVLAATGQEALWRNVFMSLQLTRSDLDAWFTGPAYLAWQRMGNLQAYGGPLSDSFMDEQLILNKRIIKRLTSLGIVPVLPTFAGFVPSQMAKIYPTSSFEQNPCWNGFNETHSCTISVSPNDSLFQQIAERFMHQQKEAYGLVTHVYSGDPFNEIYPKGLSLKALRDTAKAVHQGCSEFDPECIWVLQSWTFSYDGWTNQEVKAFLSGVPVGQALVLDLYAENRPLWKEFNSFYGHAFVWCMLHNFGGTTEMRGNIKNINKAYQLALTSENSLVGGGLTMEAINQNYIVYQFMIDRMWSSELIDTPSWLLTYFSSRYRISSPTAAKAWAILLKTIYSEPVVPDAARFSVFIYGRPHFGKRIKLWYESSTLDSLSALFKHLNQTLFNNVLFRIDYNDVIREKLQYDLGNKAILGIYEGYGIGDTTVIRSSCSRLNNLFEQIEKHTNSDLIDWIDSARELAVSNAEKDQFEENAKDLITTWGPSGQNLDYSRREWSGLVSGYYARRWDFFCEWLQSSATFQQSTFDDAILRFIEIPFVYT